MSNKLLFLTKMNKLLEWEDENLPTPNTFLNKKLLLKIALNEFEKDAGTYPIKNIYLDSTFASSSVRKSLQRMESLKLISKETNISDNRMKTIYTTHEFNRIIDSYQVFFEITMNSNE